MLKEDKRVKMKVCPKRYQNEREKGRRINRKEENLGSSRAE
jgi:hypothetical protein